MEIIAALIIFTGMILAALISKEDNHPKPFGPANGPHSLTASSREAFQLLLIFRLDVYRVFQRKT